MKPTCLFFAIMLSALFCHSQNLKWTDSVRNLVRSAKEDTARVVASSDLALHFYNSDKADSGLYYANYGLGIANKNKFAKGIVDLQIIKSRLHSKLFNYGESFDALLEALNASERSNFRLGSLLYYEQLFHLFNNTKNYEEAIVSVNKMRSGFPDILTDSVVVLNVSIFHEDYRPQQFFLLSRMGILYKELNKLDSALKYSQLAYEYSLSRFGPEAGDYPSLYLLGTVQLELNNTAIALPYLKQSLSFAEQAADFGVIAKIYLDLSRLFKKINFPDSSLYYAKKGFEIAKSTKAKKELLELSKILSEVYANSDPVKAVAYFQASEQLRDSVFSEQRLSELQKRILDDKILQKELDQKKELEKKQRALNIEYLGIAFGIIIFAILFLILGSRTMINEKIIRLLGIIGLLVAFEFINLVAHPYLDKLTNHSPVLMLLMLVLIAFILVPLHHRVEKWLITKMVEKNNKLKLSIAKKIIAKLEPENEE